MADDAYWLRFLMRNAPVPDRAIKAFFYLQQLWLC